MYCIIRLAKYRNVGYLPTSVAEPEPVEQQLFAPAPEPGM
jgi:hypothetical protein